MELMINLLSRHKRKTKALQLGLTEALEWQELPDEERIFPNFEQILAEIKAEEEAMKASAQSTVSKDGTGAAAEKSDNKETQESNKESVLPKRQNRGKKKQTEENAAEDKTAKAKKKVGKKKATAEASPEKPKDKSEAKKPRKRMKVTLPSADIPMEPKKDIVVDNQEGQSTKRKGRPPKKFEDAAKPAPKVSKKEAVPKTPATQPEKQQEVQEKKQEVQEKKETEGVVVEQLKKRKRPGKVVEQKVQPKPQQKQNGENQKQTKITIKLPKNSWSGKKDDLSEDLSKKQEEIKEPKSDSTNSKPTDKEDNSATSNHNHQPMDTQ